MKKKLKATREALKALRTIASTPCSYKTPCEDCVQFFKSEKTYICLSRLAIKILIDNEFEIVDRKKV